MGLAAFSTLINSFGVASEQLATTDARPLLHGFSISTWLMTVNNVFGGLIVALVIKHADNILRGFATALATVLATLGSVFCFGFELHASFFCGTLLVVAS